MSFSFWEEDCKRYVTRDEHGGWHLWDELKQRLEQEFGVPFEESSQKKSDPLRVLWFYPTAPLRPRQEDWVWQTQFYFIRDAEDQALHYGLMVAHAPPRQIEKRSYEPDRDIDRLIKLLEQDGRFRGQINELLKDREFFLGVYTWEEGKKETQPVGSAEEALQVIQGLPERRGWHIHLNRQMSCAEAVELGEKASERIMEAYRLVWPIFLQPLPEKVRREIAGGNRMGLQRSGGKQSTMADVHSLKDLLRLKGQIVLTGPPGVGKTYTALRLVADMLALPAHDDKAPEKRQLSTFLKRDWTLRENPAALAQEVLKNDPPGLWGIVQFHPNYSYQDFVRGIQAKPAGGRVAFEFVNRTLGLLADTATVLAEHKVPVLLIVDEINRGDLAQVLGELIYALEYRDEKVITPYPVNRQPALILPRNFYLVGTMNTADRSIALVDYAIRRRFAFIHLPPSDSPLLDYYSDARLRDKAVTLFKAVRALFDPNGKLAPGYAPEDLAVGHSYFMAKDSEELAMKFAFEVAPLLQEYHKEGILSGDDLTINLVGMRVNLLDKDQFDLQEKILGWIRSD
jgi:MoxR-like ATPase